MIIIIIDIVSRIGIMIIPVFLAVGFIDFHLLIIRCNPPFKSLFPKKSILRYSHRGNVVTIDDVSQ